MLVSVSAMTIAAVVVALPTTSTGANGNGGRHGSQRNKLPLWYANRLVNGVSGVE